MLRFAFLLPVLAAAVGCVPPDDYEPPEHDPGDFPFPLPDVPTPVVSFPDRWLGCAGGTACPLALNGSERIEIDNDGIAEVAPIIELPLSYTALPAPAGYEAGVIHGDYEGTGAYAVHTHDHGVDDELYRTPVQVMAVDRVELVPVTAYLGDHHFVTDRIAWHVDDPEAYLLLKPRGAGAGAPDYVHDGSVALGPATAAQVTERRPGYYALGTTAGTFDVEIDADSFGARSFQVKVVDHVDRVVARAVETPAAIGDHGVVCFDAFTDDDEVALPEWDYKITVENALNLGNDHSGDNCVELTVLRPGTRVSVEAGGKTAALDLPVRSPS